LSSSHEVTASKDKWDCLQLNRCRNRVTCSLDGTQERLDETKGLEARHDFYVLDVEIKIVRKQKIKDEKVK
jgi:hypothetical protein